MFENLKNMTDDEVINVINKIVTDNMDVELADLKLILAEASGRKLEKKYINIIAERIKTKIQPEPVEIKRKTEQFAVKANSELKNEMPNQKNDGQKIKNEPSKPTFDDVYNTDFYNEDEEEEKYPALSFLVGLYKVFAWIMLIGIIVLSVVCSVLLFKEQSYMICAVIFCGIVSGLIFFLGLYSAAEKIKVNMDMESHLRELVGLIKK